jgi:uncharacterized membrane protein YkvA (DUF1232 family)
MEKPWTFEKSRKQAEAFARDAEKLRNLLEDAANKAQRNRGKVAEFWESLNMLFRLVRAWVSGKYTTAPWRTIVLAITAILYFVNPLDLIPDFLPVAGFLDDAGVVAFVLESIRKDLGVFQDWERSNASREAG